MKFLLKHIFLVAFICLCRGIFYAQDIDSLKFALNNAKHDTTRCNILNVLIGVDAADSIWPKYNDQVTEICEAYFKTGANRKAFNSFYLKSLATAYDYSGWLALQLGELDKALYYYNEALKLNNEINIKKRIAYSLNNLGNAYQIKGNDLIATPFFEKALIIYTELDDKEGMSIAFNYLGLANHNIGNIPLSIDYYFKSLKLKEGIKDEWGTAQTLNNIGLLYEEQGDFRKAIEFCKRSLKLREKLHHQKGIANSLHFLGLIYFNNDSLEKAYNYYSKSLKIREEIKDIRGMSYSYQNIGALYRHKKDYEKALEYLQKSLEIYQKTNDKSGMAYCLLNISEVYMLKNQLKEGQAYAEKSLKISQEINYPSNISKASYLLSKYYSKTHNWEGAYNMYVLYKQMNDSVDNESTRKESIKSQFKYEYDKKAAADSVKVSEEKKVVAAQLKQEKTQRFALYGGLSLVIVFAGFMFNRFKVTQKQKHIIEEQKHIVDEKQKEITDSINYSKRIQTAILPGPNEIKENLKDSFILYKPKDIVSGDFYYFNKIDNNLFIAAADCTGHGVPGAFMSLVGSKELKIANGLTNSPATILKYLNNGVKDTLKQNHIDGTKDGMDIVLVRINGTSVAYAAANRPLWIIKKDSSEIEEIKATKHAIAGFTEDNFEFEEHTIELQKGDCFYLFSDGYADQFGGDKNKKMTTKRFKDYLLQIKDKPMQEQQNDLESFVNQWKGNTEQVDDILVIGVRL